MKPSELWTAGCQAAGPSVKWAPGACEDGPETGENDEPATCGHTGKCAGLRPTYNWILGTNARTQLHVQYVAAYQFDSSSKQWQRVDSSSFNHDGKHPPQDMNWQNLKAADADMFLPPHPGGSVNWDTGFTPYPTMPNIPGGGEVLGVAPPGMLFVMKNTGTVNDQFSWYVLAQRTINLGASPPWCMNCQSDTNCWGDENNPSLPRAGEIDILEGLFYGPGKVNINAINSGGCMMKPAGAVGETNMFTAPIDSPLFAAVVDKRGVTAYIDPVWEGLTDTTAAATLPHAPASAGKTVFIPQGGLVMDRSVDTEQIQALAAAPGDVPQVPPNYRELYWAAHGGGPHNRTTAAAARGGAAQQTA